MKIIDEFLNRITMYRLVLYVLGVYVGLALVFALIGRFSFSPTAMIVSLALLLTSAFVVDKGLSRLFKTPTNAESWLITSLILFLIIQPANSTRAGIALVVAGAVSSASKFLLAWNNKHAFNPAALAAALVSLTALQPTTWWIGSAVFWPFTLLLGLAIVRKVRRLPLFLSFIAVSTAMQLAVFVFHHQLIAAGIKAALLASPLLFLSTIMLTEPATMPPRRNQQMVFAAIVAVLYVGAWKVGPIYIYPEVALLAGNLYAFLVSPKFRVRLRFKEVQQISDKVYNYVFQPDHKFTFLPGQYMEWTLAGVPFDGRGNRRTFTIASSPTEENIHIGLKYYEPASAYKATFARMKIGDSIYASQLAGDFTLNIKSDDKLAYIAGGIGITPFRSMVKYLMDKNLVRDIILLYVVSDPKELAYRQIFYEASRAGVKFIPVVTTSRRVDGAVNASFSQELIGQLVPDYASRFFYVSGPPAMVEAAKRYLRKLGVTPRRIKTDHFSGY